MTTCNFAEKGIDHAKRAVTLDNEEKYEEALRLYELSAQYFVYAIKYEKNPGVRDTLRSRTNSYITRAEGIKKMLEQGNAKRKEDKQSPTKDDCDEEMEKLKRGLGSSVVCETPNVRWQDVAGLECAKEILQEAVIMPRKFPHMFVGKREPWKGILLYGPPGTGKSYLAKALATEAGATFFSVSSSDLISKWQGESAKQVRCLFELARERKPSIVFIDEIDSLVSSRGDNDSESGRRVKTEFLVQMNGVDKDTNGILVLGATNMPWSLDPAIRRRFEKRIYIPLPCEQARLNLFKIHLGDTPHSLREEDFKELAMATENFSGSDIANVVKSALYEPIKMVQCATTYKQIEAPDRKDRSKMKRYWTPCSPGDPDGVTATWQELNGEDVVEPAITKQHFLRSLKETPRSVSEADCKQHEVWTREFGQEG